METCDYCGGWRKWATSKKSGKKYLRSHTPAECREEYKRNAEKMIASLPELEKTLSAYESVNLAEVNEMGAEMVAELKGKIEYAKRIAHNPTQYIENVMSRIAAQA